MGRRFILGSMAAVLTGTFLVAGVAAVAETPLAVQSAKVTIAGTSNVHEYSASTTQVRVVRAQLGALPAGADLWDNALKPGAVDAFEVAVAAGTLKSNKDGLDKNMYKALDTQKNPDITFRLTRFEVGAQPGAATAIGMLKIAGVEREVTMPITAKRTGSTFTVQGRLDLLMTDYGIKPPVAMMGMLKTDPKVTVTFETVLAIPLT